MSVIICCSGMNFSSTSMLMFVLTTSQGVWRRMHLNVLQWTLWLRRVELQQAQGTQAFVTNEVHPACQSP